MIDKDEEAGRNIIDVMNNLASTPVRAVNLCTPEVTIEHAQDGSIRVRSVRPLGPYPTKLTERLDYWAEQAPDRLFMAKRGTGGAWQKISYREFRTAVRSVGQALLDRGLGAERPVVILSGNSIEHAVLAYAAMYAGIPHAPVSPAYSLLSQDYARLRHIVSLLRPGLVFADRMDRFRPAIDSAVPADAEVLTCDGLQSLAQTPARNVVEEANQRISGDTIAKILFTSGSTGIPKGVINTQRMLCSNQEMLRTVMAFMQDEPPVICDWLPWHHTFGGNHNVGLALFNGGSYYIDDGRVMAGAFDETVRNLREIATTVYFNVPKGWELLVGHLRHDRELRERFFSRVQLLFFAAAGLSQHVWDEIDSIAVETVGRRVFMLTGLGATETAPFALCTNRENSRSGVVGLPVPGVELKLTPVEGKFEARVRGPNMTPGYYREPDKTAQAFDEEGYYRMGDALVPLDPEDLQKGFLFDGRLSEDFKLATGTWVSVGPLRAKFILHCAPWVRDVVIAAPDRDDVAAIILPDLDHCRLLCPDKSGVTPAEIFGDARVREHFAELLHSFAAVNAGSSWRIVRAILLADPLNIDLGEITDKGTVNQKAVLRNRTNLVDELYQKPKSARVIDSAN